MKTTQIVPIGLLTLLLSFAAHAESEGVFYFNNREAVDFLETYRAATGLDLIVASNVSQIHHKITVDSKGVMTATDTARLIEKALLEQAGVVVTRLDDKRASVTYNDNLKIIDRPPVHAGPTKGTAIPSPNATSKPVK